jgi:uncharacterized protein YabN with tetrapyrrole methylase and pyrophosphatase domain
MIEKLLKLAKILRDPETGCPWDKKQTFDTYKKCLVDEAQEVVQAIDNNDMLNLQEELGDTLFNLIFIVNLAEEKNLFTMQDVIDGIYNKMIQRHPHIFGDKKATTPEEAYQIFQEAKQASRKNQ